MANRRCSSYPNLTLLDAPLDTCRSPAADCSSRDSTHEMGGSSAPVVQRALDSDCFGVHSADSLAANSLPVWAQGYIDLLTQSSTCPQKLLLNLFAQTAHTAYSISHPAEVVQGAVAKTSADYLLRSLSKARRCSSAVDLVNWSDEPCSPCGTATASVEVEPRQHSSRAVASPDAEDDVVDPLHSKLLSVVISGCLSAAATGLHDAAAHEMPGIFGAPQVRQATS